VPWSKRLSRAAVEAAEPSRGPHNHAANEDHVNLKPLFEPRSIAVFGLSSSNDRHPANVIFDKSYLRYAVTVYAVNPKGGTYHGEPIYRSVTDIPEKIDLAIIAVRSEHVPAVMEDCIRAGVGGAAVVSGGFAEVGKNDLQERIVAMAREADFPFIGPNCLGIYSYPNVDTFFIPAERMVRTEAGNVALVSQSGGILVDQMAKFSDQGVGLSLAVSIGNKALIREIDILEYLNENEHTKVIAFYIEGFDRNEGRAFVEATERCRKPIIVLKAGKSEIGGKAVSSHTASIAGNYKVFSSVLSQYGIVEADNEYELVNFCESLSHYQMPVKGSVCIISGSGGHGALAVDLCAAKGLKLPPIPEKIQNRIRERLSPSIQEIASLVNPIDLTGSAQDDDFVAAAAEISKYDAIDSVIMLLLPYIPAVTSDVGARLCQVFRGTGKPLVAYVPFVEKYRMLIEGFELNGVPVSDSINGATLMVEALRRCTRC
jgi:acetyltransferase